jgi:riboflavin kinase/FMN adenylyltransferase
MYLLRNLPELERLKKPLTMAFGVFDGVHLGHQSVIREAVRVAREINGNACVLTFHPHPMKVLRPNAAPLLLTTEEQDFELFSRLDVDACLVMDFTEELSKCPARHFLEFIKSTVPHLHTIVVGPDWHFGHGREGDFKLLKTWGASHGIEAIQVKPVRVNNEVVSSTLIRSLISRGHIEDANIRLSRLYQIIGRVVHGKGLGTEIGFPTANLEIESELLPKSGVYAARALCEGEVFIAAVNIGCKPTLFKKSPVQVEAHLLDFAGNLYGHHMRLDFISFIREERKFKNITELRDQIALDVETVAELGSS